MIRLSLTMRETDAGACDVLATRRTTNVMAEGGGDGRRKLPAQVQTGGYGAEERCDARPTPPPAGGPCSGDVRSAKQVAGERRERAGSTCKVGLTRSW
jgi:hypothetical protein